MIIVFCQLTVLMGLPWLLGFVQTFATSIVLNYIYTILNALQGVFVFLSLVITGRAGKLWRQKLCRRSSKSVRPINRHLVRHPR